MGPSCAFYRCPLSLVGNAVEAEPRGGESHCKHTQISFEERARAGRGEKVSRPRWLPGRLLALIPAE